MSYACIMHDGGEDQCVLLLALPDIPNWRPGEESAVVLTWIMNRSKEVPRELRKNRLCVFLHEIIHRNNLYTAS
jgi:hypothetical protein